MNATMGRAITTFLLKVATRCNIDCDYCYVYRGPDQSWRRKPSVMSAETACLAIDRIAEHVRVHRLESVSVILHGGEPLLVGADFINTVFSGARANIPGHVEFGMQSNLTLLTPEIVDIFARFDATIGVSLDGLASANDRHRRDHVGNPTFELVDRGLRLLQSTDRGRRVFSGVLAVIDLANDPAETFDALSQYSPRGIDFLLPDATHDRYPPFKLSFDHTPYGDWLITLFDYWWAQHHPVPIRFFENIISLLLGGSSDTEYVGLGAVDLLVIEADGTYEAVDTLKVAFDGAPALNLDLRRHSIDDAVAHPAIASRMTGATSRAPTCQECPVLTICGGGYLPHRYARGSEFMNPSVYCHDLAKLIMHIGNVIASEVAREGAGRPRS
jgi:uncharacterized protein